MCSKAIVLSKKIRNELFLYIKSKEAEMVEGTKGCDSVYQPSIQMIEAGIQTVREQLKDSTGQDTFDELFDDEGASDLICFMWQALIGALHQE